jgi:hypothetical protein
VVHRLRHKHYLTCPREFFTKTSVTYNARSESIQCLVTLAGQQEAIAPSCLLKQDVEGFLLELDGNQKMAILSLMRHDDPNTGFQAATLVGRT